jgi:group I intron endonuclease
MTYTIYKFTNTFNGKSYIGWTSRDPSIRYIEHQKTRKPRNQDRSLISLAIEKYRIDNFTFEILCQTEDLEVSQSLETHLIAEHRSHVDEHGYNIDFGGTGKRRSDSTIRKHRQKLLGKKQSAEHVAKRTAARLASHPPKVKYVDPRTPEQIKADGIAKMKATKQNQASRGELWIQSEEGKRTAGNSMLGKSQTDHQKQKAREAQTSQFIVESEDGTKQTLSGMKTFARSIGLSIEQFRYTLTSGKFKNGYRLIENLGKTHSINSP